MIEMGIAFMASTWGTVFTAALLVIGSATVVIALRQARKWRPLEDDQPAIGDSPGPPDA